MKKIFIGLLVCFILTPISFTQQFTEQASIPFTGVWFGSVAWGDYDNDDDLDILLTGLTSDYNIISKVYRNDGNGIFTEQTSISLIGVFFSSVAWGDYNNDGNLDIVLTGNTSIGSSSEVSKIYRNNGNNTFTEQTSISLPGIYQGSAVWGDYDNDGDLDLFLSGQSGNSTISKIYRNSGGTFIEQITIPLTGVKNSSAEWGDYDNDGDLDLLLIGSTGSTRISKIYRNDGNNSFSEQTAISLTGVSDGAAKWGDYNNDGNLDIVLTGSTGNSTVTKIYRNNGNNSFSEQSLTSLAGASYSSVEWGDYDNDGYLDIFLTGASNNSPYIKSWIYQNNSNNYFLEQTSISLASIFFGCSAWGDYDNDGDLDLLVAGNRGDSIVTKLYRNNNLNQNTQPSPPENLMAIINGKDVTFKWNKSIDNETAQSGLKYNLVIGTTSNGVNTLSPMSNRSNGYRKIIGLGNTNHDTTWKINGLSNGNYFWSVQALDNSLAGSGFSTEKSFTIFLPFTPNITLQPASQMATQGQALSFRVEAVCDGPIKFQWWQGETPKQWNHGDKNGRLTIVNTANSSTLTITNVNVDGDNNNLFTCEVKNINNYPTSGSWINSNTVDLTVTSGGIKVIVEGLYDSSLNRLNMRDTVQAYLRNISSPFTIVDSAKAVIDSISFIGNLEFLNAPSGVYYLVIKHRNSIETWSEPGGVQFFQGTLISYDFTIDPTKAYGSNVVKKGSKWCIYSGDVNQDGLIDGSDDSDVSLASQNGLTGYLTPDLNGDYIIDIDDMSICHKNVLKNIMVLQPTY